MVVLGNSKIQFRIIDTKQEKIQQENSDEDVDVRTRQLLDFDIPKTVNYQQFNTGSQFSDRLKKSEQQIQQLLGAANANQDHQVLGRDKEISIKQIVEDERKIIEDRFRKDLQNLKDENEKGLKMMLKDGADTKNKNEKLQRVLIDKENDLL